jgi:hypothetical protein
MEQFKKMLGMMYWFALSIFALYIIIVKLTGSFDWDGIFHMAYYLPAIGLLSAISGEIDLLSSIQRGGNVKLRARLYNFIHWLMLIGINIGAWMIGGVTIWWFILQLILIAIIGWQIGAGIRKHLQLTINERTMGIIFAVASFLTGLLTGYIRSIDRTPFGWGWVMEASTAILATIIVFKWIQNDIRTFHKSANGYPRQFFLKGLLSNFLVLWFWFHIMTLGQFNGECWLRNLGLSFNVLIGNILYLIYWLIYEYYKKKQN